MATEAVDADLPTSAQRWRDRTLGSDARARALLAELTLEEKIAQLGSIWLTDSAGDFAPRVEHEQDEPAAGFTHGLGQLTRVFGTEPVTVAQGVRRLRELQAQVVASQRLGIPAIAHEECLTGLAAFGATAFPTPLAWAATFDEDIVEAMARAIGQDMRAIGIHQGLAPVLDVVRDYRWGRVEETLGEDPYLVGQLGAAYVAGLEGAGIIATLKHFAGYAASQNARNHAPVSMGPRELAETVLPPFETALRLGGARSVMTSYTDIDGVPSSANPYLLTDILRSTWGFDGTVVADYWAVPFLATMHGVAADAAGAGAAALAAGVDVELPQTAGFAGLAHAVRAGDVLEADVDRAVLRHLRHKVEAGLLDDAPLVPDGAEQVDLDSTANRDLSRRIAEQSLVLLRDEDVLPLRGERIALLGPVAREVRSLMGCYAFPNHVLPKYPGHPVGLEIATIEQALHEEFPGSTITFEAGCDVLGDGAADVPAALRAVRSSDVAVVVVGDIAGLFGGGTSGEGCDAGDLRLPGTQHELVSAVLATGVPTVLVVVSGRPYALGEYQRAGAIVQAFFPGAQGAGAIAGLLSGRVEPTGRLPVQIPRSPRTAATYLQAPLGRHNPGISVLDPSALYPFGHGVTRGRISYDQLWAAPQASTSEPIEVSVDIANSGAPTVEVVQLYASFPVSPVVRPVVQLIGFARVAIGAGEARRVTFLLQSGRLAVTGTDGSLGVEPGSLVLSAGPSAGERPVHATVELTGDRATVEQRVLRTPWHMEAR